MVPTRQAEIAYYIGLPVVLAVGLSIFVFAEGEPDDQDAVHWPKMSDAEFDALEDRVDGLARKSPRRPAQTPRSSATFDPAHSEADFRKLVRQAIDDLPPQFVHALDHVAVVVSDQGSVQRINGKLQRLYGLYIGYGGRGSYLGARVSGAVPDRIVIFRDTLVHDHGDDPDRLRHKVTRVVRHELAHHLGWDEEGVAGLGL